jgi:LacI family transcriptional regulator
MDPSEPDENAELPVGLNSDGVIASVHTQPLAAKLRAAKIPVVNVSGSRLEGVDFPRVTSDAEAVMRMAVAHLREKGLANIAFCGEPHRPFIDFWTDAYRGVMNQAGLDPILYQPSRKLGPRPDEEQRRNDHRRWIESLPKPVGVIGWATSICRQIAMNCETSGIKVPEEVAIISLETEDLLGRVVHPPLSGVDIPVEKIGYEAARQLDRLLRGKAATPSEIHLPPLGVTTRQSTDLVACDDPHIQQALRFIRDHAHEGLDVRAVLKAVPMARRTLERRFRELLGRSPADEIRRVKIEKVRGLLHSTNMPIPEIAEACGFDYVEHMIPIFKKHHGFTPSAYRRHRMKPR